MFCFRRRIHIQNLGQNAMERNRQQNQREREVAAPNAAAQNFHRNLVHTISEAVMDAFNSAQLTRVQGSDGANAANDAAAQSNNSNIASQTAARPLIPIIPPFPGFMPHMQNMVGGKLFVCMAATFYFVFFCIEFGGCRALWSAFAIFPTRWPVCGGSKYFY